jgi:hypothetical protein
MVAGVLLAAVLPLTAAAQEGAGAQQVTAYAWGVNVKGTAGLGTHRLELSQSLSDILRDLDGAVFVTGLVRRGRLVLLGDLSASSSSRAGSVRLPPPAPPLALEGDGRLRQRSVTLAAGYRAAEGAWGTLDLFGGLRHWRVTAEAGLSSATPPFALREERRANFTDPLLGLRLNARLAPRCTALMHLDIGGFGAGARASSNIAVTLNYEMTPDAWLSIGYRRLATDYRRGDLQLDMRMAGPLLGLTWRF